MESTIETSDCEIISKRIIHFPSSLVFKAFAEAKHLKNWWGPKGFTNTFHEFDLRPNGRWLLTMHGPEKGNYRNECIFIIVNPGLISWQRISEPIFKMEVICKKLTENTTEFAFKMIFADKEECEKFKKFVPEKNEENFDRLENELKTMI